MTSEIRSSDPSRRVRELVNVGSAGEKGRGLYARAYFLPDEVIELAPAIAVSAKTRKSLDKCPDLFPYYFAATDGSDRAFFAMGKMTFANHSNKPNAKVLWFENESGWSAHLVCIKKIDPNEEITLRYTNLEDYPDSENW